MNAWKPGFMGFARREEHERGFKVTAACGFRAVELNAGSGRWDPLGRPENVDANYGSAQKFLSQLNDWGIERVASVFYDPGQMSFEDLHHGLSPTRPEDRELIVRTARLYARFLRQVGGECLVVRPVPSYWKEGAATPERMQAAAACWTAAGHAAFEEGVRIALHVDALSALRTVDELDELLAMTPAAAVGLALDTAELTIARHDPLALYERYGERVFHFHFKNALAVDTLDEYQLHNAERAMLQAGGQRGIPRWFGELEHADGLVDFPRLVAALRARRYSGWVVVESDKGPAPVATGVLLNGWYVQRVLDAC
jgi:inosose dehydratase